MFSSFLTRSGACLVVGLSLAACEPGGGGLFDKPGAGGKAEGAPGASETNVLPPDSAVPLAAEEAASADVPRGETEAPDLFKVTDKGLWDGRPSLGGTWVAHPDVTDPQRVIIRNTENGKSTVAALFRRERDMPGPAFQMSSDAAGKLGLVAGQPVVIEVVALKRPEPEKKPDAAVPPPANAEAAAAEAQAGAVETSSLDTPADPKAAKGDKPADTATGEKPEDIAAAATAAIGATPTDTAAVDPNAAPADPNAATQPVKPAKPLPKPFVEIGYFQQEANAKAAADRLTAAGMTPQVIPSTVKGQPAWRLIVGPAATVEDRAKLIADLKAMGFSAAKAVKG